ncbi:serine/threonine-protein phosphatase 6 regulatory subunit 3-like isoform X8 [Ptychodera flava]|uniref:serine/threonine-protein phosphatase 6 regulatory subunit 3-like isoform X8 n=1 Tax=Ptychodera flava TaxID=63121 RepID=UPI003969DF13
MFWKFDLHTTSHIESLLDKEDVTLGELLDEDDVLQECKAQNRKLIDFLTKPEIMEEMVNLVIQEPSEEINEKLRYKHPNQACELLTADVANINDKLGESEVLLNRLWGFLESEAPLNPLLASFFSKCMAMLLSRKTESTVEFIKSKDDPVGLLVSHIGTSAIMDLILRLASCAETAQLRQDIAYWLNEQRLIQRLIELIDPTQDENKHSNASLTVCELIRLGREQMSQYQETADEDPLLATIEQKETVSMLMNYMLHEEKSESALANGVAILLSLTEFKKCGQGYFWYSRLDGQEQLTALDAERLAKGVSSALQGVTPKIKDLHQLFIDPPKQRAMPSTVGLLDPPFGNTRLQLSRLVGALLLTNTHAVNSELCRLGTLKTLLDLFFQYSWNNFLHTQVEQCINVVLTNTPTEAEDGKQQHPMLVHLFSECKIIQRILDSWEENEQVQTQNPGRRKGYMGHLTKTANDITYAMDKGCNSELTKQQFQEFVPEDYREKWENFVSGPLAETNKRNTVDLVGGHPLHSSSEDDDADFRDIPFPQDAAMQQAFSDYQMQQMTSNFIDQFGFNDEDFGDQDDNVNAPFDRITDINFSISANEDNPNSALFEACCNERIQQFNDSGSDEDDIWEEKELTFSPVQDSRKSEISPDAPPGEDADPPSDHSDNSTDSDEDDHGAFDNNSPPSSGLESPRTPRTVTSTAATISATTTASATTTEDMKMDVDSSDAAWANFNTMEATVAMDTTPAGWESASGSNEQQAVGWASFADFNAFDNKARSGQPRSNSPVAMESESSDMPMADSSVQQKYMVSTAPPIILRSVENTAVNKSSLELQPATTTMTVESSKMEEDGSTTEVEPRQVSSTATTPQVGDSSISQESKPSIETKEDTVSSPDVSSTSSSEETLVVADSASTTSDENKPSGESSKATDMETAGESKTQITIEDVGSHDNSKEENEEDEGDLDDNFDSSSSPATPKSSNGPTEGNTANKQSTNEPSGMTPEEKARLEKARAEAIEALEQWKTATQQNGPV